MKDNRLNGTLIAFLALCGLLTLFFNDVLFRNKTLKSSATIAQALERGPYQLTLKEDHFVPYIPYIDNGPGLVEEPFQQFKKNAIAGGYLPLWNPYQACGIPFLANALATTFFLPSVFLYILPERYSWDFYIIFLVFTAGFLTYYFMRLLGYSTIPSLASGVAYMFSGPLMVWMVNATTNTAALLPLLFICVEKLIRQPGKKWVILSSFSVAVVLLSGHPEQIFFAFLTTLIYFMLRLIFSGKADVSRVKVIKSVSIAFFLGLILSAVFIIPFLEYLANSWIPNNPATGLISEEDPRKAITILVPYFFQNALVTNKFVRAGWMGGYLGIMTVLLAFAGIFKKDSKKNNLIFGAIALFIILKCYGAWPVNWVGALPILNKMRYSMHYTQDFAFAMAILAGVGLQRFIESKNRFCFMILLPALLIGAIILGHAIYYPAKPSITTGINYTFILLILVVASALFAGSRKRAAVLLVLLLATELFYLLPKAHAPKYEAFAQTPYIDFIKKQDQYARSFGLMGTLYPNIATGYGISDLGIYEPVLPKRFVLYATAFISQPFKKNGVPCIRSWLKDLNSPFLDLLGVEYLATVNRDDADIETSLDPETTQLVYSKEAKVYRRKTAFPRVFIARRALFAADESEAIKLLYENSGKLRDVVVIEGGDGPGIDSAPASPAAGGNSKAAIKVYTPNYVKIESYSDHPGFLVLSDSYYPGWEVFVDCKKVRLLIADVMLRAVSLEKGRHAVEFYYRPFSFLLGAVISAAVFLLLIILLFTRKGFKV